MSTLTRLGTSILVRALTIRISSIPQRNMSGDQSTSSVNLGGKLDVLVSLEEFLGLIM